jgi:hypothetical protein
MSLCTASSRSAAQRIDAIRWASFMKHFISVLATALSVFFTTIPVDAAEIAKNMTFIKGQSSAAVQGSVIRGDRDIYTLRVRAGQNMSVNVTATENNAVFSIYAPRSETPIPGTEEENDVASWNGTIQTSGAYRIVVGGTRGNATYKLHVSVK